MIMNIPALDRILGIHKADWAESKHPRASNGQFGSGGGGKESAGAKHKRNQQARRAESAGQSTLGGGKAIQTLLGGGSALDKIGWLSTSKPKQETPKEPGWPGEVPEKKPLPADGASLNDFTESWISRSKYADKYRARPDLVNHQAIEAEWVKSLRERASEGPLSNAAIESFTEKYGEAELLRTFRGVEGKGLQNYVPKDRQMAHQQNPMMFGAPDQSKPKEPEKPAKAPTKPPENKPEAKPKEPAKPTPAKIESAKDIIQGNLKSGKLKRETVIAAVRSLQEQANEAKSKGDHAASKDLNFQAAVMVDAAGIKSHELISSTGNATRKPATPARQNAPNRATDARNDPRNDPRAGDPLHDPLPRGYRVRSPEETARYMAAHPPPKKETAEDYEREYEARTGRKFDPMTA